MDILCKCGHHQRQHLDMNGSVLRSRNICFFLGPSTSVNDCPCMDYSPDNLSYIEKLATERGLI